MEKIIPIIIVTYNKLQQFTLPCIESIVKNTDHPYKIIIVDNNSSDNTAEIIKDCYDCIDVISVKDNLGWDGGNILGIKHIEQNYEYDYYCLLNSDTLVSRNWLGRLRAILDSNDNAESITPTERIVHTNAIKEFYIKKVSQNALCNKIIDLTPLKFLRGKGISMARVDKPKLQNDKSMNLDRVDELNRALHRKYNQKVEKLTFVQSGYCVLIKKSLTNDFVTYLHNFESLFPKNAVDYWNVISREKNIEHLVAKGVYVYHYRGGSGGY